MFTPKNENTEKNNNRVQQKTRNTIQMFKKYTKEKTNILP